jgi:hypothetical protein
MIGRVSHRVSGDTSLKYIIESDILFQLGVAVYRKFWYKTLHNINFDNPVYRKNTEEAVGMERGTNGLLSSSETASSITTNNSASTTTTRTFTSTTLVSDASEVNFIYLISHLIVIY